MYLSDADFVKVFSMTKEDFTKLAAWKQTKLKKEHHLY
jgi:hypothetical protein